MSSPFQPVPAPNASHASHASHTSRASHAAHAADPVFARPPALPSLVPASFTEGEGAESAARDALSAEAFYLQRKVFVTLQREAAQHGVEDWRVYARGRLAAALAAHALLLDPAQAEALREYAETLGVAPEELLAQLLTPDLARRDRYRRHAMTFLRSALQRHRSQQGGCGGCLLPVLGGAVLLTLWLILCALAQALGPLLAALTHLVR